MKVPPNLAVGVCSHTGHVRNHNEDDYLLGSVPDTYLFLAAIADGMGGLAGGAEASRTALRAFASTLLDGGDERPVAERVNGGFVAACARVHDAATAVPALRDMGTTLTTLCLRGDTAVFGHVGDTRLYRRRGGGVDQLTVDHAAREPGNLLLRCIGGGQATAECDVGEFALQPGDRFVLVTDGVWSVVPEAQFARLLERAEPQQLAEQLVASALRGGGPDNATVVVVDVLALAITGESLEVALPQDERPEERQLWPRSPSLRSPWWPWLLLVVALLLLVRVAVVLGGGLAAFGLWPG